MWSLTCEHLLSLIVKGSSITPWKVSNGHNIIIVQQAYQFIIDVGIKFICVICNSTNVFVLFAYFYQKLGLQANVFIQAISGDQSIVDLGLRISFKVLYQHMLHLAAILWHHIMV